MLMWHYGRLDSVINGFIILLYTVSIVKIRFTEYTCTNLITCEGWERNSSLAISWVTRYPYCRILIPSSSPMWLSCLPMDSSCNWISLLCPAFENNWFLILYFFTLMQIFCFVHPERKSRTCHVSFCCTLDVARTLILKAGISEMENYIWLCR